ncbi:MAG: hypothetical protein GVY18_10670 [Bacteroidetes bacterium]|nr:hypothetical protein [Bacteroidota bacterium]
MPASSPASDTGLRGHSSSAVDPRWYVLPGALLLYVLRFGYDYGTSDQDEVIPYLLHLLKPELFASDWFVQAQVTDLNVRTVVVWLLRGPAEVLPVWLVVLLAFVAVWLLLAGAVWALTDHFTGDRVAAAIAVVLTLVMTPQWTLGGNDLAHSMLVPSMMGWALALWGLWAALQERWLFAGALLGLATWMQALVGLQVAGIIGIWLLVRRWNRRHSLLGQAARRAVVKFIVAVVLVSAPVLGPILIGQVAPTPDPSATPSLFYIMAQFRLPHHYLPSAFPVESYVKFGGILLLGGWGLFWLHRRSRLAHPTFVATALATVAGLAIVGTLCTEVVPWLFVAKLQLFKATVVAKLLALVGISGAVTALLPGALKRFAQGSLRLGRVGLLLVTSLWGIALLGLTWPGSPLYHLNRPGVRLQSERGALMTWAQRHTPTEAQFAVPPSWSDFRTYAQRSIVVNFKAIPYREPLIREWFARLTTWAPIDLPERAPRDLQHSLDSSYSTLPPPVLLHVAEAYAVDYVVRPADAPSLPEPFQPVQRNGAGTIYRVSSSSLPPGR